jgi:hypothetical protein
MSPTYHERLKKNGKNLFEKNWANRLDSRRRSIGFVKSVAAAASGLANGFGSGHANTLTLIDDVGGFLFGCFTPVKWESRVPKEEYDVNDRWKRDDSMKTFLFMLKNSHNIPVRKSSIIPGMVRLLAMPFMFPITAMQSISCSCCADCGIVCTNNTGPDRDTVFTRAFSFQVKEITVFEITDYTRLLSNSVPLPLPLT